MISGEAERIVDIKDKSGGLFENLGTKDFETGIAEARAKEIFEGKNLNVEVKIMSGRNGDDTERRLELLKLGGGRILLKIKAEGIIKQFVGVEEGLAGFDLLPDLIEIRTTMANEVNNF